MQLVIGVTNAKQIELDVADPDAVIADYEKALADGDRLVWVVEEDGRRHGIVAEQIAYFEIESEKKTQVGFAVG